MSKSIEVGNDVWLVMIHNLNEVVNAYVYTNREAAEAKYVELGNSWYERDEKFTSEDELDEYQCSDEWWDESFDHRITMEVSVLEGEL